MSVHSDSNGPTRIKKLRQSGSSKLVFPAQHAHGLEAVLVNTAGGITGGDVFTLDGTVEGNATLTVTTQAAERAYRAQPGETGHMATTLSVAQGATLNWLPQELILYERCALDRTLSIELHGDARLLMVEPILFGRAAMQETLRDIHFRDRIKITRDGRPLYLDGLQLMGDATTHLSRAAIGDGAGAMASILFVDPEAARLLETVRAMLPPRAGASLIAEDTVALRLLGSDSFMLRRSLIPLLERLQAGPLPTSWRL